MNKFTVSPGHPLWLGATLVPGGCRLSLFSRNATAVWLQLYDSPLDYEPREEIALNPAVNRTGDIWHIQLTGDCNRLLYLWRVDGPDEPSKGHRFDPRAPLLDPCARAVAGEYRWDSRKNPDAGRKEKRRNLSLPPKCLVLGNDFDWGGDRHPSIPLRDTVIYETARARLHPPSLQPGEASGHVSRPDRKDRLSQRDWVSPRSSCCRCTSSTRTR